MLSVEKTLDELLSLIRNYIITNVNVLFRPRRIIDGLEKGEGVPSNPRTYLLISTTICYWLSKVDNGILFELGDLTLSPIFKEFTDISIILMGTIVVIELCILPFRVNQRRRVFLTSLAYIILGFGSILPIFIFSLLNLSEQFLFIILIVLLLLILIITYIIRIFNVVGSVFINNLLLRSKIQLFVLLIAVLVVGQTYAYVFSLGPNVSVTPPHGSLVPFHYQRTNSSTYMIFLDLKINNLSNVKIVLPEDDSMMIVPGNPWNYKYSRFSTTDNYIQIKSESNHLSNILYFKRKVDGNKQLVVKSKDFELVRYQASIKSSVADTLILRKLNLADRRMINHITDYAYTLNWVVNFKFYGKDNMHYYAVPIQLTGK